MAGKLPVPYISQLGPQASKFSADCGAACGVMLIRAYTNDQQFTVDQFYEETGRFSGYLWVSHLTTVLANHHVPTTYNGGPIHDERMRAYLDNARPMIVLFNYGVIQRSSVQTYDNNFMGSHFAVLVGADSANVYLHDPLWPHPQGKAIPVPLNIWNNSWNNLEEGNGPRTAIIPDQRMSLSGIGAIPVSEISTRGEIERMQVVHPTGMNVREGPGTNYFVVDAADPGSTVSIVQRSESNNEIWGRIGYKRWIAIKVGETEYLKPIRFPGSTRDHRMYEIVSQFGLNVRKGTGIEFPIVDHLPQGVIVKVFSKQKVGRDAWGMIGDDQWIAIKYKNKTLAKALKGIRT